MNQKEKLTTSSFTSIPIGLPRSNNTVSISAPGIMSGYGPHRSIWVANLHSGHRTFLNI